MSYTPEPEDWEVEPIWHARFTAWGVPTAAVALIVLVVLALIGVWP